jgi:hypothetical protein
MGKSIDEVLSGDAEQPEAVVEQAEEQAEVQTEAEPEAAERPRGPDGKFISKETEVETPQAAEAPAEPAPSAEQNDQLPPAAYAALKDERRKRQALEDEVQRMRDQFARMQAQPQQPQQQPVDFWENPESFLADRDARLAEQLFQRMEQRQQEQRLEASEQAAKAKYADYDDAFRAFEQAVQLNPRLAQELAYAPDPGEFAYSKGKTALELQRVGSIDELIRAERQKWEAEAMAAIQPARQPLPSTTAVDGSVGARGGPEWSGPKPLGSYLR